MPDRWLVDLRLPSRANLRDYFSGIDSPEHCLDSHHFRQYPHKVDYQYNSRGFRDDEWPQDLESLQQAIWCIGDSFTVGIGQPYAHIWPQVLSTRTSRRTINVAMDGASNAWIARRARQIQQEIAPTCMIIMWSYWHRRELPDVLLPDEQRRLLHADDLDHASDIEEFERCSGWIDPQGTVDQCLIPNYSNYSEAPVELGKIWNDIRGPSWPQAVPLDRGSFDRLSPAIIQEIEYLHACTKYFLDFYRSQAAVTNMISVPRLDLARDGHHFDVATSEWLVDRLMDRWRD